MDTQKHINESTSLNDLLSRLREVDDNEKNEDLDWTSLPTFGGVEPHDTSGVWSWDESRALVGTCLDDMEIVERERNELVQDHIRAAITRARYSHAEIARELDWSAQQLNQRISVRSISLETCQAIAGVLGVSVSELIGE